MTAVKGTANICLKMGKKCPLSKLITLALYKVKRENKKNSVKFKLKEQCTEGCTITTKDRHTEHIWELVKTKSDNHEWENLLHLQLKPCCEETMQAFFISFITSTLQTLVFMHNFTIELMQWAFW